MWRGTFWDGDGFEAAAFECELLKFRKTQPRLECALRKAKGQILMSGQSILKKKRKEFDYFFLH